VYFNNTRSEEATNGAKLLEKTMPHSSNSSNFINSNEVNAFFDDLEEV